MKQKTRFASALLLAACSSLAQATTYDVSATFSDGGIQGMTTFTGSFDWNASTDTLSNFTGMLSESMYQECTSLGGFSSSATCAASAKSPVPSQYLTNVYSQAYANGQAPVLSLTHDLATSMSGNLVTATVFLQNSTNAVSGGGYDVVSTDNATTYGNSNAFFTLVFDASNITNTSATASQIVYGDFTALGLMMPMLSGTVGMTGYASGGSMGGMPTELSIAAVPVPGAVWLFGSALAGLFGINRRKAAVQA